MSGSSPDDGLLTFYRYLSDASKGEPYLPPSIRAEIHHRFRDLLARVKDAIVRHWDPKTVTEVRGYEASLRGHALAYLVGKAVGSSRPQSREDVRQLDEWKEYLWDDEANSQRILADTAVRDVEDIIHWLVEHRHHKRRLKPRRST